MKKEWLFEKMNLNSYNKFGVHVCEEIRTLSRKEKEKIQHRQYIIDAAMQLFSEQGYHFVSMQEIAAAAEFSTGTLYKFFPSKRELFREIMLKVVEDISQEVRPVLYADIDEIEFITKYLEVRRTAFQKRIEYVRLYNVVGNGFGLSGDDVVDAVITQRKEESAERIARIIQRGVDKGVFKPVNVELATRLFEEFCQTIVRSEARQGQVSDEDIASIAELFLHGILA
ncbi:MAG: TetR/AcrR family transcriptional regulator [Desulfovibrionales bacterium]|nr:TetR/AcrR family transcriptional regulator [Desulfovibrionales bacterium]